MAILALSSAFRNQIIPTPTGRVLFLRARYTPDLDIFTSANTLYLQQAFKPAVDELAAHGYDAFPQLPAAVTEGEKFQTILLLPPRQRDEARSLYCQALELLEEGGQLVVSIANTEGAKSGESDIAALVQSRPNIYTKHKSRVIWIDAISHASVDSALRAAWRQAADYRNVDGTGLISKPGMFSWDHVDPASRLLADHLPTTLRGTGADLGAGYGYLSSEVLKHTPAVTRLALYEADAEALAAARLNIGKITSTTKIDCYWHDVCKGLHSRYDFIVSNPPFHALSGQPELNMGIQFIVSAAQALHPHGEFVMVANTHLAYEQVLHTLFHEVSLLTQQHGFKVIHAKRPR